MPATLADIQRKYGDNVYPIYKDEDYEPYMESDNGFGYKGIVLINEIDDKIQCAECGGWFRDLNSHLHFKHKTNHLEYKQKFGLFVKTPLCSKSVSEQRSENAKIKGNVAWEKIRYKKGVKSSVRRKYHRSIIAQGKNRYGLCDAQIAARLVIVRDMAGKENMSAVTSADLQKYDNRLLLNIQHKYGNYRLASKALGLDYIGERKYEPTSIIAIFRNFVRTYKFIPKPNQFSKHSLPSFGTIALNFGSWRRAKMMAGLDQLLAEVKSAS